MSEKEDYTAMNELARENLKFYEKIENILQALMDGIFHQTEAESNIEEAYQDAIANRERILTKHGFLKS